MARQPAQPRPGQPSGHGAGPAQGPQSRGAAVSPMTGKPIPPPPGFRGPLSPMTGKPIPPPARPAPGSPGATRTGSLGRVNAPPGRVKVAVTLAPEARPSYRAVPPAGRGTGPGKVARLLPAVARWLREAARPGRADRCHVPVLRVLVARGQVLALAPASALVHQEGRVAQQAVRVLPGCAQVARGRRLAAPARARFLEARTRPTGRRLRAAPPTEERRARVYRREVAAAQVAVPAEAPADAAAGAARAGAGRSPRLTAKSYRPRRRRHTWPRTRPCPRVKSSSNGVRPPRSWRPASTAAPQTWCASCSRRARW